MTHITTDANAELHIWNKTTKSFTPEQYAKLAAVSVFEQYMRSNFLFRLAALLDLQGLTAMGRKFMTDLEVQCVSSPFFKSDFTGTKGMNRYNDCMKTLLLSLMGSELFLPDDLPVAEMCSKDLPSWLKANNMLIGYCNNDGAERYVKGLLDNKCFVNMSSPEVFGATGCIGQLNAETQLVTNSSVAKIPLLTDSMRMHPVIQYNLAFVGKGCKLEFELDTVEITDEGCDAGIAIGTDFTNAYAVTLTAPTLILGL